MAKRGPVTDEERSQIFDLMDATNSARKVALIVGRTRDTVARVLAGPRPGAEGLEIDDVAADTAPGLFAVDA